MLAEDRELHWYDMVCVSSQTINTRLTSAMLSLQLLDKLLW